MKKLLFLLVFIAGLGVAFYYYVDAVRKEPSAIKISCHNLSGTWQGRYFEHEGPYAGEVDVKLMLYVTKAGTVVGKILPLEKRVRFANETVRGICKHNKLKLYFFANYPKERCGVLSHATVIDRHNIDLDLHWENAMTGGHGTCPLYRVSEYYDPHLLRQLRDFNFYHTKVRTCH